MTALWREVEGDGLTAILLAHGFTQTGHLWGQLATRLAAHDTVIRVDMPGHGDSRAVRADVDESARLLVAAGPAEPFDVIGYSMGARVALAAAIADPARVRRLILIGGTPGIEDDQARKERRTRDEGMADDLEASGDVDAFVERWLSMPMFQHLNATAANIDERRRNSAAGLASSLRLAGAGAQTPLWDALPGLQIPVLLIVGADDHRFSAIGDRMRRLLPNAVLSLIPGAGHAAHLEQPLSTTRLVEQWRSATASLTAESRP